MATSSSVPNPFLGYQITEKLNKINHALWWAQVLAAVRGARMESHITGKSQAPAAEVEEKKSDDTTVKAGPRADPLLHRQGGSGADRHRRDGGTGMEYGGAHVLCPNSCQNNERAIRTDYNQER